MLCHPFLEPSASVGEDSVIAGLLDEELLPRPLAFLIAIAPCTCEHAVARAVTSVAVAVEMIDVPSPALASDRHSAEGAT